MSSFLRSISPDKSSRKAYDEDKSVQILFENAVSGVAKIISFTRLGEKDFQELRKALDPLYQKVSAHVDGRKEAPAKDEKPKHSFLKVGDILISWLTAKANGVSIFRGYGTAVSKINWVSGLVQIFIEAFRGELSCCEKKGNFCDGLEPAEERFARRANKNPEEI